MTGPDLSGVYSLCNSCYNWSPVLQFGNLIRVGGASAIATDDH